KPRLEDRVQAEVIARAAEGWSGPLTVVTEDKRQSPPRLFDLPALQKTCSARFGWTADKTLEVAQDLYQNHGHLLTYPRAESRYLAEAQIGDAQTLTERLSGVYGLSAIVPVIRRGKDGVYSDKGLEGVSHHAVIPNVNGDLSKLAALDADGRRLFDLVAKAYLAAHHPDHLYRQTTVTALVEGYLFRATGRITTSPGWTAIYDDRADDEGGEAAEAEQTLPPLINGDPAQLSAAKVEAKRTKPPPRYTEGTLIQAMQESWRFIPDSRPDLRERLRDAKGIGTPATRAEVIKGLKRQDMLAAKGKLVVPSDQGMSLYKLLAEAAPRLVDPGVTALWELRLDQILLGRVTADQVIQEIAHEAEKVVAALTRRVAEGNLSLLAGSGRFGAGKQAGLSPRLSAQAGRAPTDKQVAFLTKLSKEKAAPIPAGTLDDMARTSAMIDHLMGKGPKLKAKAPKRAAAPRRTPRKARGDAPAQAETA
ncbi:MAG TPA: DNA topoisomerase, partial [Patescibacteria group bacterium]|nr:DNA topoisomerase [Patescibacteria group bacterium]